MLRWVRKNGASVTWVTVVSLALLSIGLAPWGGYAAQGSYVDENGVLQEPFHLLALGWLLVLTGGAMLLVAVGVRIIKRSRNGK